MSEDLRPGEQWFEDTDPIIEDILWGLRLGYYQPGDAQGVRDDVAKKLQDLMGYEGPTLPIDHYSLVIGHVLGQAVERMRAVV